MLSYAPAPVAAFVPLPPFVSRSAVERVTGLLHAHFMSDPVEAELLTRAQAGDRAAFGRLMRLHQKRVYACAVHMLGDRGDAEDATQETFLRAFRAIAKFDRRSELSTWLYRICVNVSLNLIRKRKRTQASDINDPRVPEPEADPVKGLSDPRLAIESAQVYDSLSLALDELSPSLRATVTLVCIEGVSHKEAAEILGCPEGTIAWRIHEARSKLRYALVDENEEEKTVARSSRRRGA